jgi:rhomboid protease GluP
MGGQPSEGYPYPQPPAPTSVPVRRSIPLPQTQARITYIILAINVIIFLLDTYVLKGMLTYLGVKDNASILRGEVWRFITPIFLHANLGHIGVNSYSLWIVGPPVERSFGYFRFLAIYLLSGIAGVVASFLFSPALSLGASGAIFGLVGALIPLMIRNQDILANIGQRIRSLALVIGVNLLFGLAPGIDNWGHIGGLLGGLTLGWFTAPRYAVRRDMMGVPERIDDTSSIAQSWLWFGLFAIFLSLLSLIPTLTGA